MMTDWRTTKTSLVCFLTICGQIVIVDDGKKDKTKWWWIIEKIWKFNLNQKKKLYKNEQYIQIKGNQ